MIDLSSYLKLQDSITIFLSIVIEAIPFVVLGVLVSTLLEILIKDEWLLKLIPKNRIGGHIVASLVGMIFPVCECGNVPVTRELIAKGFSVSQAISFYLGAPILNFVVILTTFAAFEGQPLVIWGRIIGGFLVATSTGILISYLKKPENLLTENLNTFCELHHEHDHNHKNLSFKQRIAPKRIILELTSKSRVQKFLNEFIDMTGLLVIGALLAAITRTWIPQELLLDLAQNPILATLVMMLLAVILSVCSTVDAFIVSGYATNFNVGALLGFLIYGPMIDVKAISMLLTSFKPKLVGIIVILVTGFTLLISLGLTSIGF